MESYPKRIGLTAEELRLPSTMTPVSEWAEKAEISTPSSITVLRRPVVINLSVCVSCPLAKLTNM
jgi:hypothetical protein